MSYLAPDIYALDPAARQLLQLDTFRNKFVVNEFIQGLAAANIASSAKESGNALDPRPYIRTFEAALTRLQDLRDQAANEGKELETELKSAESQFSQKSNELEYTFKNVSETFTGLQNRISQIGKTAITIGKIKVHSLLILFRGSVGGT